MAEVLILPTPAKSGARVTRAMSLPTLQLREVERDSQSSLYPASPDFHEPLEYPDLPEDPRTWTSTHVAAYLTYSLALYPPPIINDLSRFVRANTSLDGRRFLRLKEDQLRYMGFNERWITLIMVGVKTLRRESLKGKILKTPIVEEPEPPLPNDGDEYPEYEGVFETTYTTTTSSTTISSPESEKDADNRWFIQDEPDNPKETRRTPRTPNFNSIFDCDDVAASALPLRFRWLVHTVRDTSRELLPDFMRPAYGSGFAHGALVGGIFVWACCRVASNWRN